MMTPAQHDHYIGLWGAARKALRASGVPPKDADARRKAIHAEQGAVYRTGPKAGQPKSSMDLTNPEFDRVKGAFLALARPSDVKGQINQADQWARRLAHSAEAQGYLDQIGVERNELKREAYVDGICRNITRRGLIDLPEDRWPDVIAALKRTAKYKSPEKRWPSHDTGRDFVAPAQYPAVPAVQLPPVKLVDTSPDDEHDALEPVGATMPAEAGDDCPF